MLRGGLGESGPASSEEAVPLRHIEGDDANLAEAAVGISRSNAIGLKRKIRVKIR
jgi:hypothetical protein